MTQKSAKGVIFRLSGISDFCKIITILRNFFKNANICSQKFIFRRNRVYIFENCSSFVSKGSKIWSKFWSAKGKGLNILDTYPYCPLYRNALSPPGNGLFHFFYTAKVVESNFLNSFLGPEKTGRPGGDAKNNP